MRNAFTKEGRTDEENEAFDYVKKLLNWRKNSDAIKRGGLKHFVPEDNVYVYNRSSEKESVLVVINNNSQTRELDLSRFSEVLKDYESATDLMSGEEITDLEKLSLDANKALVLKLNPTLKTEIRP